MKCGAVRQRLAAYVDREVDEKTRVVIKTHLGLCSACSVAYDRMCKTLKAGRAWQPRPLPEGFVGAVVERAALGERPRRVRFGTGLRVPRVPRIAWQVGAACVLVGVGVVLGHVLWPRQVERVVYERGVAEENAPEREVAQGVDEADAPEWAASSGMREVRRGVVLPKRLGGKIVERAGRLRRRCVEAVEKVFGVDDRTRRPWQGKKPGAAPWVEGQAE